MPKSQNMSSNIHFEKLKVVSVLGVGVQVTAPVPLWVGIHKLSRPNKR